MNQADNSELIYKMALTLIPGIGPVSARTLVSYCGSAEAVLKEKYHKLMRIPNIGEKTAREIVDFKINDRIEEECEFIQREGIQATYYLDKQFPHRLKHCMDAPIIIYSRGSIQWNAEKVLAIVGTRKSTAYGKDIAEKIVEELKDRNTLIISGMAYGIDICAHKAALKHGLPTVGVMAHGLDQLYPSSHASVAKKMYENGGLLSEYVSGTLPVKENFPARNRIIAGMSDAVLVVEAAEKGGALITAYIAGAYNRDVFAVPGRSNDLYSKGCNDLIKKNLATLVQSATDIEAVMGWVVPDKKPESKQTKLLINLKPEEELIVELLRKENSLAIDALTMKTNMNNSKVAATLLSLEFSGIIRSLPGKMYELI